MRKPNKKRSLVNLGMIISRKGGPMKNSSEKRNNKNDFLEDFENESEQKDLEENDNINIED